MLPTVPPNRLSVTLQPSSEEVYEPDAVSETPLVRFVAYGDHQRVFGWVRLRADRLTDLLNAHEELHLVDVEIESLLDGTTRSAEEIVINCRELVAVLASGPRGDLALRQRTRSHPIGIESGNYLIGGRLHADPGADPISSLGTRPTMVPLTDAWIEYWSDGERKHQSTGTIIVNRAAADSIRVVTDEDLIEDGLRPFTPRV